MAQLHAIDGGGEDSTRDADLVALVGERLQPIVAALERAAGERRLHEARALVGELEVAVAALRAVVGNDGPCP